MVFIRLTTLASVYKGNQKYQSPPSSDLKCNFDGAWNAEDGTASAGWVLRDAHGNLLYWGGKKLGVMGSALETEAESFLWAAKKIRDLGFRRIHFSSDCRDLVTGIAKDQIWPLLKTYAEAISVATRALEIFSITFNPRTANKPADAAAKLAKSFISYSAIVSPYPPSIVASLISAERPNP